MANLCFFEKSKIKKNQSPLCKQQNKILIYGSILDISLT